MTKLSRGKVITVCGEVAPAALGAVLMHEHLVSNCRSWRERRPPQSWIDLLMDYAVPNLRKLNDSGCHAYVDCTPMPWRASPDTYVKVSRAASIHIVLCTGFYREMEVGSYWVRTKAQGIWPVVRQKRAAELAEMCIRDITEGVGKTKVRAGAIKVASSNAELTPAEEKAFRAAALAQTVTGVHITTHCTQPGAHISQLRALTENGVDPARVVVGHTMRHVVEERRTVREWMRRGATFCPTNLRIDGDWDFIRRFVRALRRYFDEGLGDHLVLGLDWAFETEQGHFLPCTYMPPPPYRYMFTHVLPRFRALGLEEKAIEQWLVVNPQRILPVQ